MFKEAGVLGFGSGSGDGRVVIVDLEVEGERHPVANRVVSVLATENGYSTRFKDSALPPDDLPDHHLHLVAGVV